MSKGRSSSYPERPPRVRFKKPSKGRNRPSSETIHGRRRTWIEKSTNKAAGPRDTYDECSSVSAGHMNSALSNFLANHRFKVPLHIHNKKGRTVDY